MSLEQVLQDGIDQHAQSRLHWSQQAALHESARATMIGDVNAFINSFARRTAVTFEVGVDKQYKTIQSVIDLLRDKVLAAPVLIKVADGIYDCNAINIDRFPYAHKVKIEGNVKNPDLCVIKWIPDNAANSHGIGINGSKGINISGFKFVGQTDDSNFTRRSIFLGDGSSLYSDSNSLVFEGGQFGIELYDNSLLFADKIRAVNVAQSVVVGARMSAVHATNTTVKNNVTYTKNAPARLGGFQMKTRGFWLFDNSHAFIAGSSFDNLHDGFTFERGSHGEFSNISLSNCYIGGLLIFGGVAESFAGAKFVNCQHGCIADHNSMVSITEALFENCPTLATRSDHGSSMYVANSAAKNCGVGYQSINGSLLHAKNTSNSGNTVERDVDQYSRLIWS